MPTMSKSFTRLSIAIIQVGKVPGFELWSTDSKISMNLSFWFSETNKKGEQIIFEVEFQRVSTRSQRVKSDECSRLHEIPST
jgi:hypothetical protein